MEITSPQSRRDAARVFGHRSALADTLRIDFANASLGVPLRVGAAVGVVLVVGGLLGQFALAGFAALGSLVSAFCRTDPYRVRAGRLLVLGVALAVSLVTGSVLGAMSANMWTEIAVLSILGGAAALLVGALHISGPGAVVFVFGATGAAGYAQSFGDVGRVAVATAAGAVCGIVASLAPWILAVVRRWFASARSRVSGHRTPREARSRAATVTATGSAGNGPGYESVRTCLTSRPHTDHLHTAARIVVASAISGVVAVAFGLSHPLWASMGAVAAMQGIRYHRTVQRGIARLVGNVVGGLIAAALLALPLGHWGAIAAIVVLQIVAEICAPWNYAITSAVVTPMALLMTALSVGLHPSIAIDRVLDTLVGVVIGIVIALLTVTRPDIDGLLESTGMRHPGAGTAS